MEKCKETNWGLRKKGAGVIEDFPQVLTALVLEVGTCVSVEKRTSNLGLNLDILLLHLTVNSVALS